ncbi:hypothetical protein LTS17_003335 [Exophiala oligosperma]
MATSNAARPARPARSVLRNMDFVSAFVKVYTEEDYRSKFYHIAQTVADEFKKSPPVDDQGYEIKYQLSCRGKDAKSIGDKLRAQTTKSPFTSVDLLLKSERIWDLAAVRVLAYFPDDVPIIARKFEQLFRILDKPIVGLRKARETRPNDPSYGRSRGAQFEKYTKGTFTQKSSVEAIVREWKHSGYRAVHFHVEKKDETMFPKLYPWQTRVEVQISTVVMHAWSEVEHDMVYKNPFQLPQDTTMDRMVDAINGLSITNETLLQELQQSSRNLRDHEHGKLSRTALKSWILNYYFDDNDAHKRSEDHSYVDIMVNLIDSPLLTASSIRKNLAGQPFNTRQLVKSLLPEKEKKSRWWQTVYSERDSDEIDDFHLLKTLLRNSLTNNVDDKLRHFGLVGASKATDDQEIYLLYRLLLVSSWYSIWMVIGEPEVFGSREETCPICGQLSPQFTESSGQKAALISQINRILIGKTCFSSLNMNKRHRLEEFCNDMLNRQCGDDHEIALRLAKLSLFVQSRPGVTLWGPTTPRTDVQDTNDICRDWSTAIDFSFLNLGNAQTQGDISLGRDLGSIALPDQERYYYKALNRNTPEPQTNTDWNRLPFREWYRPSRWRSMSWVYELAVTSTGPSPRFKKEHRPDPEMGLYWVAPSHIKKYLSVLAQWKPQNPRNPNPRTPNPRTPNPLEWITRQYKRQYVKS